LERGRKNARVDWPQLRLCKYFWQGEQYKYIDSSGMLRSLSTTVNLKGGGKPNHRVRQRFNFIDGLVQAKVSSSTQRIPSYEVVPSTTDPSDAEAAQLAEKILLYGYDKWNIRRATTELVTNALVQREGFAYPYWDSNVGPYMEDIDEETGEVKTIGQGEVKVKVLSAEQVFWEPGMSFDESPWVAIETAMYIGHVYDLPGYLGGKLTPNASAEDNPTDRDRDSEQLVMVTEYLERPSINEKNGRRLFIADNKIICKPEDFPIKDHEGVVVDEPALIRLSYIVDPTQDRDRGLVDMLIDPQRTINDCISKQVEWKNRCLNPQILAPIGSINTPMTDVPGALVQYRPTGGQPPSWQPTPNIPTELFQMVENALTYMRVIAADIDVQADPNLAARTAQAAIEQSNARWAAFLGNVAMAHQQIARRNLWLVQRHYTEPRKVAIQGTFGADLIKSFMGADLNGQADVRVSAGTLEVRSRDAVLQEASALYDRQVIDGPQLLAIINSGVSDRINQTYQLNLGRVNRIMRAIKEGNFMEAFPPQTQPTPVIDPATGAPAIGMDGKPVMQDVEVPGWMPRPGVDKIEIHMQVMSDWQMTTEWDMLSEEKRAAGQMYFQALQQIEADAQAQMIQAQNMQAEQQGSANASLEQKAKPLPDKPNMDGPPANKQP